MIKKLAIILGSRSDLPKVEDVIRRLREKYSDLTIDVHILSCHRNPIDTYTFVFTDNCKGAQAILYAGGKAFAAPGIIKAFIEAANLDIPVIGIALGEKDSKALNAAILSIEELPGTPVVMKEDGAAYVGPDGLEEAFERIVAGNLPALKKKAGKPPEFCIVI
ncbi:MAG: AIR carboxylase family protein [Deltaproteobacteria bacterium]|nr:AIR carboxylase family protein [Deltaproteobacteria bacterium]